MRASSALPHAQHRLYVWFGKLEEFIGRTTQAAQKCANAQTQHRRFCARERDAHKIIELW
jgi:hypothetical protein